LQFETSLGKGVIEKASTSGSACNPSYWVGRDQEELVRETISQKKIHHKKKVAQAKRMPT
jgi:hypothetical protein